MSTPNNTLVIDGLNVVPNTYCLQAVYSAAFLYSLDKNSLKFFMWVLHIETAFFQNTKYVWGICVLGKRKVNLESFPFRTHNPRLKCLGNWKNLEQFKCFILIFSFCHLFTLMKAYPAPLSVMVRPKASSVFVTSTSLVSPLTWAKMKSSSPIWPPSNFCMSTLWELRVQNRI